MAKGQLADGQLDFFIDLFFTIKQNFDNFADLLVECNKVSNTTGAAPSL